MEENMFALTQEEQNEEEYLRAREAERLARLRPPDYTASPCTPTDHLSNFLIGFGAGFVILFVFYKIIPLSLAGGAVMGIVNIFLGEQRAIQKRLKNLRIQFYDMLEAMSVSMRAGNPVAKALASAREDLRLIYSENSDIIVELDIFLLLFDRGVRISEGLTRFAERCGLEDVASFASVYATIEGKAGRADEIVRETQQIISDKMAIEMEIDTLMTAAKSQVNIMLAMPLLILLAIGYAGAGFMDMIYTDPRGRIVATVGLVIFIASFILARRFSNIDV